MQLQCQYALTSNFMKIEFENTIRKLIFLCSLPDIKTAQINPWYILHTYIQYPIQMYFGTIWTGWVPKNCAEKVLVTLVSYIFHVKTKWKIVYEYLKTKIFSRDTNILPQMYWTSNIFGPFSFPRKENKKKTAFPKNSWMQHWHI